MSFKGLFQNSTEVLKRVADKKYKANLDSDPSKCVINPEKCVLSANF